MSNNNLFLDIKIDAKVPFYKSWLEKKTFYWLKISSTMTVTSFLSIFSLKKFISKPPSLVIPALFYRDPLEVGNKKDSSARSGK